MTELYVKESNIEGKGIFVRTAVKKGKRVGFVIGERKRFNPKTAQESASIPTWYGVGKTIWIDPGNSIFRFFNHSCEPNTAIIGSRTIIARRDIAVDEEITVDYSMTDVDTEWTLEYECKCGTKQCRKTIKSIQHLPPKYIRAHLPLIPKFFLGAYKRAHPNVKL